MGAPNQIDLAPRPTDQRTLRTVTRFYTRTQGKHKHFELDAKPDVLKHLDTIDHAAWRQYQTYLKRTTPLERAEFYRREMEQRRSRSVRAFAKVVGKSDTIIRRYLKLLELPEPIQQFLRDHRTPVYVRYFTDRKLTELVELGDSREAWRRFREMLAEADREGGIWRPAGS